ncbi:MAG: hypothetical protein JWO36_6329 [Myxococcales bacterium]|nr:hypothetical protein [Myxococcales bacterium]
MRFAALLLVVALVLAACGDDVSGEVTVVTPPAWSFAIGELVKLTPSPALRLETTEDPARGGFQIVLADDAMLAAEAYALDTSGMTIAVRAHDLLGAQYGVAAALESLGFRFRHPFESFIPTRPMLAPFEALGVVHAPEVRVRGIQLHTLHPIEGYFAFWESGHTEDAHRVIDWLIKNRGNFLQWVALDDIMEPGRHADWQAYTRELIDYAHARGVRVGLNIELYGQSNLQLAFDLSDDQTGMVPIADEIAARLPLITKDLPFDVYDLSFGEFFGADPARFISSINEVAKQLRVFAPSAEMHAVVHVGATQRVMYMGEDLIYYFLVKFADPTIVPELHTVMYYDLFEDAGGAYHHDTFAEHLAYLRARMCAHQPAGYFPETAYWVAFDDSIPTYLPLYAHSRWLDLSMLHQMACAPLDQHLIFSSGWEWGYWLNDVAALRASYEAGGDPRALTRAALSPDLGDGAAALVDDLADAQHAALIDQRLAAYLASRDAAIDAGRSLGIVSQPDRVTFEDLVAATPDARDLFATNVLAPLGAFATRLDELALQANALDLPRSRWAAELRDGFEIDRLRAEFIVQLYRATLAHLRGGDPGPSRDNAAALFGQAKALVAARHRDLHDPHGEQLIRRAPNSTFYQYGYLFNADTLCYWKRELSQVDAILGNTTAGAPACLF